MNERLKYYLRRLSYFFRDYAKPTYQRRITTGRIINVDAELDRQEKELHTARMRLLELQGTPRGSLHG